MKSIRLHSTLKILAYFLYTGSVLFLVLGFALSAIVQPASAAGAPNVSFDQHDHSVCFFTQTTITATGHVTLPTGQTADLQTQWDVVHPDSEKTAPAYHTYHNVSDGFKFSIDATWPGVHPGDTVVEIHYGALLLNPNTTNPLSQTPGSLDLFWYPYVNCGNTAPTATFTATRTSTATSTSTDTFTPTVTPTSTSTNTPTMTPTPTNTSTGTITAPTNTFTPTFTPTPTETSTGTLTAPTHTFTPTPTATTHVTSPSNTPTPTNRPSSPTHTPTPTNRPSSPSNTPTSTGVASSFTLTPTEATQASGSTPTNTTVPTLAPAGGTSTPVSVVAVTGADLSGPAIPIELYQRVSINLGIGLFGLALLTHGVALRLGKAKK